jgi:hypothetical protein
MKTSLRSVGFILALALTACVDEPVQWGDVSYRHSRLGDPPAISMRMDANLPAVAGTVAPCRSSVAVARRRDELFRAWWGVRADSNAVLSMQQSRDRGRTWESPVEVDARDHGRRGCTRPGPGMSADSASGYVYVVYFLDAEGAPGVFFAHSMDDGRMFHSPVPVVYGRNPSRASVAGRGDSVVVVFEDPNATSPTLGMVLSHTTGHIFDQRSEVVPEDVRANWPWVTLAGNRIGVWWMTPDAVDRVGHREGTWK